MNSVEQEYYENYGGLSPEKYLENYILNNTQEISRFQKIIDTIPENINNLLDVGCGHGVFLNMLKAQRTHLSLKGLERSPIKINLIKEYFGLDVILGEADKLPFDDNSFDVVTAMEVIEHIPYYMYSEVLKELERVARNQILITVPYKETRVFVNCPACKCKFNPNNHLRTFTDKIFDEIFNSFKLVKFELIYSRQLFYSPWFTKVRNTMNLNNFGDFSICPSCGYKKDNVNLAEGGLNEINISIKGRIKKIIPKSKIPLWAIAVYQS